MKFILAKKLGMSQIFDSKNKVIPVTLVEAGPCPVVQVKDNSVQIGFEEKKEKHTNKAQQGHFKKAGLDKNFRYLKEFPNKDLKVGDVIDISILNPGEKIRISGISKGKGFQGVVKRHGFSGADATHGTKHNERAPGSIGSAFPERVFKGKKMAGRMGTDRITTKGLTIVAVDKENNTLAIKGAVPGRKGTLLEIIVTKEVDEKVGPEKQKSAYEVRPSPKV
ncbi:50S ribosomal protein L3 [Patescibacteria group bacterium]|nr:50S ribosomal protein L3 [Patescibacteria group bacterium]MBU1563866.1 50S ribosomal protein L3 [Patescibacteria group bacterium]